MRVRPLLLALVAAPALAAPSAPAGAPRKARHYKGHDNVVTSLALDAAGKTFASAAIDGSIRIWSVDPGRLLRTIALEPGDIAGRVALSPDGKTVVAAIEGRAAAYATADGKALWSLAGAAAIKDLEFSADGSAVALAGDGVRIVAVAGGEVLQTLAAGATTDVAFSPAGSTVVTAGEQLRVWSRVSGAVEQAHPVAGTALALSGDGRVAVVTGPDGTLRAVDLATGAAQWEAADAPASGTLRVVGDVIYGGLGDRRLAARGLAKGDTRWWIEGSGEDIQIFAVGAAGRPLLTGGDGNTVILWIPGK